jgi:hypothetical protein
MVGHLINGQAMLFHFQCNGKEVWVDISHVSLDPNSYHQTLLQNGLKQNISLMIAKAVIAMFHTRNEFSDWDAALHTFTFANAVHQGLIRISTPELLRGVFDAAMNS